MATEKHEKLHDYTNDTNQLLTSIDNKLNKSNLNDCIYELLNLEKRTRLAVDVPNTLKLAQQIISICFEHKQYTLLVDNLIILMKRRAQLQKVQEAIIQQTIAYIDQIDDPAVKKLLCERIREITDGKLFVEIERARATRYLANYTECVENNIVRACELIQEIQVETIGAMSTVEKTEILLEQFRLNLIERNYIRAEIISKKIDLKHFTPSMNTLRDKYYNLMIRFYSYYNQYVELTRLFRDIYYYKSKPVVSDSKADTEMKTEEKESEKQSSALTLIDSTKNQIHIIDKLSNNELLNLTVLYGILSKFDAETTDILQRLTLEKSIEKSIKHILEQFLSTEIMKWPFSNETQLKSLLSKTIEPDLIDNQGHDAKARLNYLWSELHQRLTEHNIRVISTYYTHIHSKRLAELLELSFDATESIVCKMVQNEQIQAKINRTTGVIQFNTARNTNNANNLLNNLTGDIHNLLSLVDQTNFLIQRESMIHGVKI